MVCAGCGLRTHPEQRCPRCAEPLIDMRDDLARETLCEKLLASARYRQPGLIGACLRVERRARRSVRALPDWAKLIVYPIVGVLWVGLIMLAMCVAWLFACVCALAGAALGLALGMGLRSLAGPGTLGIIAALGPMLIGFGSGGMGGFIAVDKLAGWMGRRRKATIEGGALRLHLGSMPAADPLAGITEIRGRVVARDRISAPMTGLSCVGFRLRGDGRHGTIDDGDAVDFEVRGDDGSRAIVQIEGAWLALEGAGESRELSPDGELARFLGLRGALLAPSPITVREIVLCEGDMVTVAGLADEVADSGAYRDGGYVRRLRARGGAPLIIRCS